MEILTNKKVMLVRGEEGLLTFSASGHFRDVKENLIRFFWFADCRRGQSAIQIISWLRKGSHFGLADAIVFVGSILFAEAVFTKWEKGDYSLEIRTRINKTVSESKSGNRSNLGKRWKHLYLCRYFCGNGSGIAWVEEDCGAAVAQEIARELVIFLRRSGTQTQVSVSLSSQASEMKAIQELQLWIAENFHKKLSIQILAIE